MTTLFKALTSNTRNRCLIAFAVVCATISTPTVALAGMPAITFHDLVRPRLEVVSFFLVGMVLSSAVVCGIWNFLRRDFPRLPRLSFGRAFGLVTLWCLLFVVVLTMISGARELMTPGAWKRDGLTYQLRADESADESGEVTKEGLAERHVRRDTLMRLYRDLSVFAAAHAGRFPTMEELADLPNAALEVPHLANLKYGYVPRRTAGSESKLLAFEPVAYGDQAWGLFTDGEVRQLSIDELRRLTAEEAE